MERGKLTAGWLEGLALGLLLATVSCFILFWILDAVPPPPDKIHDYFIAFFTTAGTLLAALSAVRGVGAQIKQASDFAEDRRLRALRASVAMMPLALSDLINVSKSNVRRHFDPSDLIPPATVHIPTVQTLKDDTLTVLRDCIQYVDEASHLELLFLFRSYQILLARGADLAEDRLIAPHLTKDWTDHKRISDATNWATLHAASANIFGFARGQTMTIPPRDPCKTLESLSLCGVELSSFPNLNEHAAGRIKNGTIGFSF